MSDKTLFKAIVIHGLVKFGIFNVMAILLYTNKKNKRKMKRFKEIKELLSRVYFNNDEAECVITFLENIGFKNSLGIVINQDDYETYLQEEHGEVVEMGLMPAIDFFQECTGREIDDHYSLSTVLVMAIDDYVSQLKELKEQHRSNEQDRKGRDIERQHKKILLGFVFMAYSSEDSLKDISEDLKRRDEKDALKVLEAMNSIVK